MAINPFAFSYKSDGTFDFHKEEGKYMYVPTENLVSGTPYIQMTVQYLPNQQFGAPDENPVYQTLTLYFKVPDFLCNKGGVICKKVFDKYTAPRKGIAITSQWLIPHDSLTMYDVYRDITIRYIKH